MSGMHMYIECVRAENFNCAQCVELLTGGVGSVSMPKCVHGLQACQMPA